MEKAIDSVEFSHHAALAAHHAFEAQKLLQKVRDIQDFAVRYAPLIDMILRGEMFIEDIEVEILREKIKSITGEK